MTAVQLGPIVLSTPRFAAIVGLLVLVVAAHLLDRKRPGLADRAWTTALLVVLAARLGFALENLGVYLREPLTILYFWQGGFSPLWGLALAIAYTVWREGGIRGLRRQHLTVAVFGLVAWGGAVVLLSPADQAQVHRPDAPLLTLSGDRTALTDVAAGRPLVLNLWAPWCPPCRRETPMLIGTAGSHPETAFALADQASSPAEVDAFLAERDLPSDDVYRDASARLGADLAAVGLPTTFFFAADGHLVHAHAGEISRAELEQRIRSLHE